MAFWDYVGVLTSNMNSIIIASIMLPFFGAVAVLMEYTFRDTKNYTHKIFALSFEIFVANKVLEVIFNLFSATGVVLPWALPYTINTITVGFAIYLPITLSFLNKVYTKQWYYTFMILGAVLIFLQFAYIGVILPLDFSITAGLITELFNIVIGALGASTILIRLKRKDIDPIPSVYLFLIGFILIIVTNIAPAIVLIQALIGIIPPYTVFGHMIWPIVQIFEVIIGLTFTLSLLVKVRGA